MSRKIKTIVLLDFIFLILLMLSGSIKNVYLSDTVYFSAFVIPILAGLKLVRLDKESFKEAECVYPVYLSIRPKRILDIIPFIPISVGAVMLISYATSKLMGALGFVYEALPEGSFLLSVLTRALIPAMLEELLFRYIPLNLLSENRRCAVIISSLLFAFSHASLFKIPYAFAAGVIFALIDVWAQSIVPSFVIHFLNNVLSLLTIFGIGAGYVYISVFVLAFACGVFIFIKRKRYEKVLAPLKDKKIPTDFSAPIAFIITTSAIAILTII